MFDKVYLQRLFADQVGSRLELYRVQSISPYKSNFRCSICGDSNKNKYKKRGYILEKEGSLMYCCHNGCGNMSFVNYLKRHQPDIYTQYRFEMIKEWKESRQKRKKPREIKIEPIFIPPVKSKEDFLCGLQELKSLVDSHPAKEYIMNRLIPLEDIWYAPEFVEYIHSHLPGKLGKAIEHPRIIIPLRRRDGSIFGVSARSHQGEEPKYLTVKFDEDHPKIFNLEKLDVSKHAFVLEGQLDAKFIDNSLAFLGTDGSPQHIFNNVDDYTVVLDNQPRNPQVTRKYEKYIRMGCNICIWPAKSLADDINQMILNGVNAQEIMKIIKENTFKGLRATIEFKKWRKHGPEISNPSRNR